MPLHDLDLEFEDEEVEKKSDAVSVDLDIQFATDTNISIQKPSLEEVEKPVAKQAAPAHSSTPAATTAPAPSPRPATPKAPATSASNVRPITPKVQASPQPAKAHPIPQAPAASVGNAALKVEAPAEEGNKADLISALQGRIEQIEIEAQIKIAVAEFKTDILSDLLSDIKLLEHQINGLLVRIHTKHPDMKQEVLMIKKLLSDFSTKKRR